MSGSMAFSMVFNVIDAATAPIRGIAAALAEPARAAVAVGDAADQAGSRLGSGMDRAQGGVRRLAASLKEPIAHLAELSKAAGEASEKFARSFAGMGALVAEGFSIKEVAGQEEFWRRMQINTGMTEAAVEHLKDSLNAASIEFGVGQGAMMEVFKSARAAGGTAEMIEANAHTIAAAIQLTGTSAEDAGKLFATMQTKMHMTAPKDFLDATALLRERLVGIEGGVPAFAEAVDRMGDSMEALGMKGRPAFDTLGAVYAVAAKGAGGNARLARSSTEGWLHDLTDRGYQAQLSQGLGERITDRNGRVKDPFELVQAMVAKYTAAMRLPENQQVDAIARLDSLFGESGAKMSKAVAGEVKSTGRSGTMERILAAKGDGGDMMKGATEAGETLTAAMSRLRTEMGKAAETVFTGPIRLFADALNACGGAVADVVIGLAALAMVGHTITWIAGAIQGFKLLKTTLLTFRVTSLVSGLAAIATGFVPVIAATWAWTAALLANPVTWIVLGVVAAVAAVGVAIYALYRNWDRIWGLIGGVVKTAISPVTMLGAGIKDTLGGAWDFVKTRATEVLDWCGQKLDWLFDKLKLVTDWASDTTKPARDAVKGAVATVAHSAPVKYVAHAAGQASGAVGDAARNAMAYFEGMGWGHHQAAGIAASLKAESGFRPGAVGDGGHAYGLGQWHEDRQRCFAKWAGHDIRDSKPEEQLAFVHYELTEGAERAAGRALAQTTTAAEAGAVVSKRYERPADRDGEAARRGASAEAIAAESPQPLRPLDRSAPAASVKGVVVVRFENPPPGMSPRIERQPDGLSLLLDRGPLMAMG